MNKRICDFVSPRTEPDFFDHPGPDLREIQDEIRRGIETASEVMTIIDDNGSRKRTPDLHGVPAARTDGLYCDR